MAHLRLFLVLAAFAGLGYLAYRQGWLPISFNQNTPSAQPTLGFEVHQSHRRRRHVVHGAQNLSEELALASRFRKPAPMSRSSSAMMAAIPPGSNALEIPGAPTPAPTAAGPKLPFPKSFEGCWEATITQPDDWTFGRGPIVKGWTPATHVLCFHYSGSGADVTFSTSAGYPVISDWLVSDNGIENGRADIMFSGDNFVVLRTTSSTELRMKVLGIIPGPTGIISSLTDFHCTHLPNDKLMVEASTVQRCRNAHSIDCDGDVWIKQSWHTEFGRQ
jgi:hypothetical protein